MPQPRKPSKILEMTGAFDKNPDRARVRANEPVPAGELRKALKGRATRQFDKGHEGLNHHIIGCENAHARNV